MGRLWLLATLGLVGCADTSETSEPPWTDAPALDASVTPDTPAPDVPATPDSGPAPDAAAALPEEVAEPDAETTGEPCEDEDCDDGDPCTADTCAPAVGCLHIESGLCECASDSDCPATSDPCAGERRCVASPAQPAAHCEIDPSTAVFCPPPTGPDALCQTAACAPETGECVIVAANDGAACSSESGCTFANQCAAGACVAGPPIGCNDGNPCTQDTCVGGVGCEFSIVSAACDDGDECTTGDACVGGACEGAPVGCDDADPCTADGCVSGLGCVHAPAGDTCDDGNPCTEDTCAAGVGCVHGPDAPALPCDDGNPCTTDDACTDGACSGAAVFCDDEQPCTADVCDPAAGCVHPPLPDGGACDDDDACTTAGSCLTGACLPGPPVTCDDGSPCTVSTCVPPSGCVLLPADGVPCSDGDACTTDDGCDGGACAPGAALPCDDANPCTDDTCAPAVGCVHTPSGAVACDDGDACTTSDACAGPWCLGEAAVCEDGDDCTLDDCDSGVGCVHIEADGAPCNDGDACTGGDQCAAGLCAGVVPLACDDGDACTVDSCDPGVGCVASPLTPCCGDEDLDPGEACDDGNQAGGDGCSADCSSDETCGNAVLDVGEVCDGAKVSTGCHKGFFVCEGCQQLDASSCTSWCGDGALDSKHEACDGEVFATTCHAGALGCAGDCSAVAYEGCSAWCGDGVVNGPEQCDGGAFAAPCPVGTCTCSSDCTLKVAEFSTAAGWAAGDADALSSAPATPLHPACADPDTLCFDAGATTLDTVWIPNAPSDEMVRLAASTSTVEFVITSLGVSPSRTAIDPRDGSAWWANRGNIDAPSDPCNNDGTCSSVVHMGGDDILRCRGDVPGGVYALALDRNGQAWAGSYRDRTMYKISRTSVDDSVYPPRCKILGTVPTLGRPYGAAADASGNVWVGSNDGAGPSHDPAAQSLERIDAVGMEVTGVFVPPASEIGCWQVEGIGIDGLGRVLVGAGTCRSVVRFDPATGQWEAIDVALGSVRGVVADYTGQVFGALAADDDTDLHHLVRVDPDFGSHAVLDLGPTTLHPSAVAFDAAGRLWTTGDKSAVASWVHPDSWAAPQITTVSTQGPGPHAYGEMCGLQHLMFVRPRGRWTRAVDSGATTPAWQRIAWLAITEPTITELRVRVRTAISEQALDSAGWSLPLQGVPATPPPGQGLAGGALSAAELSGVAAPLRWLEVEVLMESNDPMESAVLASLSVHWVEE